MLTKSDLSRVKKIVRGEVGNEIEPVKRDIAKMRKDIDVIISILPLHLELRRKCLSHF